MPDEEKTSCPAMGVYGMHSEDYYDGGHCMWCGEKGPEPEDEEEEEE